jgi:ribonuclease HI
VIEAYTDGACRSGQCSCAWSIYFDGKLDSYGKRYLGPEHHTNNYAEYMGLIAVLELMFFNDVVKATIYSDSQLVVRQVNQIYETHDDELRPLMHKASGLLWKGNHTLIHVKGHAGNKGNEFVDKLCNQALDEQEKNAAKT